MNFQEQDFLLRRPSLADAPLVLELMIACDLAEYGEADSSLEDLLYEWEEIDLEQDAWLLLTLKDDLAGYAAVFGEAPDFTFDFYSHPAYVEASPGERLVALCLERIEAQLAAMPEVAGGTAATIIPQVNQGNRQALESAAFKPRKYYFRMQIEMDSLPASSLWSESFTIRTIIPDQEARLVYDFIQQAFDRPGRTPPSFENWSGNMMRPDHFVPELWFLLFHEEELTGAALCFDYEEFGWVRQLGVSSSWRRQGLGSRLLQHVFRVFYQRGHRKVALGVDSENPKAYSLYENVGMACVRRFDEYHKTLEVR